MSGEPYSERRAGQDASHTIQKNVQARLFSMRILSLVLLAASLLFAGCKAIESGYEGNREKQNAKTDKALNDAESQ
jgi:hypothetical protein